MKYTALYRKFRPSRFEEVSGQDAIITTLKNQIMTNRIGHAYLFCGTRGTGKTTIAKIFARAVNCENPRDGSPCGECALCQAIAEGSSMNVIEIDAASNNGVDSVREIVEEVTYSPVEGKYKVYIIDEVHMLSTGAFNALLKTLEEPPEYVIFILATTELHKIPLTILSRCQRYDFKRITVPVIVDRLEVLMKEEKIEAEEKAILFIAKSADGAMRDAISTLDQCVSFYFGEKLTFEMVLDVLGVADTEVFSRLLRSLLSGDAAAAIKILEETVMQGRELSQFVIDFTWYLRNLMLLGATDENLDLIDMSAENMERLKEETKIAPPETVMRYIRIFSEVTNRIRFAAGKRVQIEIALIKACKPEMETDLQSLTDRIRQLEARIGSGQILTGTVNGVSGSGTGIISSDIGISGGDSGVSASDIRVSGSDSGISSSDIGISGSDSGVSSSDSGISGSDSGISSGDIGVPDGGTRVSSSDPVISGGARTMLGSEESDSYVLSQGKEASTQVAATATAQNVTSVEKILSDWTRITQGFGGFTTALLAGTKITQVNDGRLRLFVPSDVAYGQLTREDKPRKDVEEKLSQLAGRRIELDIRLVEERAVDEEITDDTPWTASEKKRDIGEFIAIPIATED